MVYRPHYVNTSNDDPVDGDTLVWDATAGQWKSAAPSGGGVAHDYVRLSASAVDIATAFLDGILWDSLEEDNSGTSLVIDLTADAYHRVTIAEAGVFAVVMTATVPTSGSAGQLALEYGERPGAIVDVMSNAPNGQNISAEISGVWPLAPGDRVYLDAQRFGGAVSSASAELFVIRLA